MSGESFPEQTAVTATLAGGAAASPAEAPAALTGGEAGTVGARVFALRAAGVAATRSPRTGGCVAMATGD